MRIFSGKKKGLPGALAVLLAASLMCAMFLSSPPPAGAAGPGSQAQAASPGEGFLEEEWSRPYYNPDAAATPEEAAVLERLERSIPEELLPASLLPEDDDAAEDATAAAGSGDSSVPAEGGFDAAGTGAWTTPAQLYLPSSHAEISYGTDGHVLDGSGRLHAVYSKAVTTDIGQAPDAPAFTARNLQDHYFATFDQGVWDVPGSFTQVTGLQDSNLIWADDDPDGYIHLIYSKWVWGRDASKIAGDASAYQHEEENLWYMYVAPDGSWSTPRRLTALTGSWELIGADFIMRGGQLYGTLVTRINYEPEPAPAPSSYRAEVGFLEGYLDSWEPVTWIDAWNYDDNPGSIMPIYWPSLDVSTLNGEVTVTYAKLTVPGVDPHTEKIDAYGCVRDPAGAWSGPENLSNASANEAWMPVFTIYRGNGGQALVLTPKYIIVQDATHHPRDDFFLFPQSGGAWSAPLSVTRAEDGQAGSVADLNMDAFGNLDFSYVVIRLGWDAPDWQPQGGSLHYTRLSDGGLSDPATIMGYTHQRYPDFAYTAMDADGCAHVFFSGFMYDGVSMFGYAAAYSTNAPGGDPTAFSSAMAVRLPSNYVLYDLALSVLPGGDVLASWSERGFDAGGDPTRGMMCSRLKESGAWGETVVVSSVPGSTDMLHVFETGWPYTQDILVSGTGEQQAIFETAKYDVATHTWYDFRKYFSETVGGAWTTPQLITGTGISWKYPWLLADGGQRYFASYDATDTATGKTITFATQQLGPTPPASTYFFAEGTTRDGFNEWLCLQNSGEEEATVSLTYMLETGENIEQDVTVPAHARATVNVNEAVEPEHDVSTRVAADRFIVAERPMYFDYHGWTGGHCVMGAREASRLWYFAEGTTRDGFDEYLTLQNPSDLEAHVNVTYVLGDGTTVPGTLDVGPRSRGTIKVNDAIGPGRDVSLVVESDRAVVAERPMYFDYQGLTGGHCEVGSTSLAGRWYFAEGTTRDGFDTYICLQNPYGANAEAALTFILEDGTTVERTLSVPATSRQTLRVNDAVGPGRDVSTVVTSQSLLLAERPMYFLYGGKWAGGHVASGVPSPKNAWFFAEGTTRDGFEEWLSLQNPCGVDATASLSLMLDDGAVREVEVPVPAHTRVTVSVPGLVEPGRDVSVMIECDRAIVAERPIYFLYGGEWAGGHVVAGL